MRVTSRRKQYTVKIETSEVIQSKELVVIDQKKIRKKYISGCKRTIKDLEKARNEWNAYETVDIPSYEKWYNQNFGSTLSEVRDAETQAKELYRLLAEIQFWKEKKRISFYQAYLLVMDRKKNPDKYRAEDEAEEERRRDYERKEYERQKKQQESFKKQFQEEIDDEDEELDDDEIRTLFEMFVESTPGMKSQLKDKKVYEYIFKRFKEDFFNSDKNDRTNKSKVEGNQREDRIKTIYRTLVRKLHPDFQKDLSKFQENIWHEVQIAYKENDLEKLETLLALSEIQTGDFSEDFSISQILNVQFEYKSQLKSLRARIKQAKKNPEWGFTKLENKKRLFQEIQLDLKRELNQHKRSILEFEEALKQMSTPPIRRSNRMWVRTA
ncbi:MAG: hypothetical protein SFU98_05425 [Leptospiraceae bacterium]|nr:hypothetical protein [Leptospiraceae bacterium]